MDTYLKKIIWLIIPIPAAYLAITWASLPASVPMHYNLHGEVDRYGSKEELLILIAVMTALSVAIYFLLPNIYRIDPKKNAADNKGRLYRISFALVVFLTGVTCTIIYSSVHANITMSSKFMLGATGLLFTILGNYMYTIKPNYFAGFRLPWTLSNDENWRQTHLLAGKLFFAAGLVIAVLALITPFIVATVSVFILVTLVVVVTCIFSYRLYKKQMAGNDDQRMDTNLKN